ncbi:unnamed protein product [Amoebophrya sp. A25]|nr:unnamed protein product [Amoebophrya sp. A25]|eukprot:GSA25T00008187001.1
MNIIIMTVIRYSTQLRFSSLLYPRPFSFFSLSLIWSTSSHALMKQKDWSDDLFSRTELRNEDLKTLLLGDPAVRGPASETLRDIVAHLLHDHGAEIAKSVSKYVESAHEIERIRDNLLALLGERLSADSPLNEAVQDWIYTLEKTAAAQFVDTKSGSTGGPPRSSSSTSSGVTRGSASGFTETDMKHAVAPTTDQGVVVASSANGGIETTREASTDHAVASSSTSGGVLETDTKVPAEQQHVVASSPITTGNTQTTTDHNDGSAKTQGPTSSSAIISTSAGREESSSSFGSSTAVDVSAKQNEGKTSSTPEIQQSALFVEEKRSKTSTTIVEDETRTSTAIKNAKSNVVEMNSRKKSNKMLRRAND